MTVNHSLQDLLYSVLQLKPSQLPLHEHTPLLGALPELDSMAVVAILTGLETLYDFTVEDDEIDASVFATYGSLQRFVTQKLSSSP
ncbi:MAG: acyl carrier protein [Methylococcales bacterium]|nr:acyl carrier protein [Methylococcales bacterium]